MFNATACHVRTGAHYSFIYLFIHSYTTNFHQATFFSLDALDPNAYEAFKASRNLRDVVDKVLALGDDKNSKPGMKKKLSIRASVMTPISPMLVGL